MIYSNLGFCKNVDLNLKNWHLIKYKKISQNIIQNEKNKIIIKVQNSASPIVYKFDKIKKIKSIQLSAELKGKINYKGKSPGSKGADDFPLRIGLIIEGRKKLNFFQRTVAADWLLKLNNLAKKHKGFKNIYSLIYYQDIPTFKKRKHPMSSYFIEEVAAPFSKGVINYKHNFKSTQKVIGLWINADGDDTKSTYSIIINKIKIE